MDKYGILLTTTTTVTVVTLYTSLLSQLKNNTVGIIWSDSVF